MDNLDKKLRDDAARIRAKVSPELDARIRASLEGVEPERPRERARPVWQWWLPGLVGAGMALSLLLIVNPSPPVPSQDPPLEPVLVPALNFEQAVLTAPLEQELDNLESDLKKAERAIRAQIGLEQDPAQ